jgi:hypothetical protein
VSGHTGPSSVARFFGGLLMAVGGMIAILSGLCSTIVTIGGLVEAVTTGRFGDLISAGFPIVLMTGGIPFAIGLGLFFAGRAIHRGAGPAAAGNTSVVATESKPPDERDR